MSKFIVVILICILATSCTTTKTEVETKDALTADADTAVTANNGFTDDNPESYTQLQNYLAEAPTSSEDVQEIDSTGVILVDPTDEQITQMEKEYGEEDLATVADDASFYEAEAIQKLDSFKVKTTEATKRFLKFSGNSKTWLLDIRKEGAPEWNLILFNKNKTPEIIPTIDLTHEKIKAYFELK
jgi:hypothetical protein